MAWNYVKTLDPRIQGELQNKRGYPGVREDDKEVQLRCFWMNIR
jgi:hypothetical protein